MDLYSMICPCAASSSSLNTRIAPLGLGCRPLSFQALLPQHTLHRRGFSDMRLARMCSGHAQRSFAVDCMVVSSSEPLGMRAWHRLTPAGTGRHPYADPWGVPFSDSYWPDLYAAAGSQIAARWRGVLDGLQGDQEWLVGTLKPKSASVERHYIKGSFPGSWRQRQVCMYCKAVATLLPSEPQSLVYTAFGEDASHRSTCLGCMSRSAALDANNCRCSSALVVKPGLQNTGMALRSLTSLASVHGVLCSACSPFHPKKSLQGVYCDILHIQDLQIAPDIISSMLIELSKGRGNPEALLTNMWEDYMQWCHNNSFLTQCCDFALLKVFLTHAAATGKSSPPRSWPTAQPTFTCRRNL